MYRSKKVAFEDIQLNPNVWVQIVAMFLSQTVTVLGLPSLRQQLKELEEQREQRRPEVEVNMGPGCGEMLNSE